MTEAVKRVTVPEVAGRKGGERLVMLTAADTPAARVADQAGVDILLVGDSLAMVVLGHPTTLEVGMEEMIHHARAVARGRRRALLDGDMPWLSYHLGTSESLRNAGRFIQAGCDAVKVEGGARRAGLVEALIDAEIPVMGHIGLTPQSYHRMGGFKVQGRDAAAAERLLEDARALERAGAFSLVLEGIPAELARRITGEIGIPTIGIGAGPHCDGQVLVFHDLVGWSAGTVPRFVRRYADLDATLRDAIERFAADVRKGEFPAEGESYHAASGR